jgi:predicted nucleotidyltransferase/uncharacterized protein (DUF433 family)
MESGLKQKISINLEGKPVITGTSVTIEDILGKLAVGYFLGDIMDICGFSTDRPILAAVTYAESLPLKHPLAILLQQYRHNLKQKVNGILNELRRCFKEVYRERLVQLVLFGSQARGDAKPGSDIDVLVVLKEPVDFEIENQQMSEIVAQLSLRYTEVINCIFVDENAFQHSQEPLLRNVRLEGVMIV